MTMLRALVLSIACVCSCNASPPAFGPQPGSVKLPDALSPATLNSVEAVFVGKLTRASLVGLSKSAPPIYHHSLSFSVEQVLSGDVKVGTQLHLGHSAKPPNNPIYPVGERVLVGMKFRGGKRIHAMALATDKGLAIAHAKFSLPVGWSKQDGKLLSPWAKLGKNGWTEADDQPKDAKRCAATGRPTYMVGQGVRFTVEHVPSAKPIEGANPNGVGRFTLTLTNTTDKPVTVPALRRVGQRILWDQCAVILCQGKTYTVPGAGGVADKTTAVTLAPGQSVTHEVNVLALDGPKWPSDGSRIAFTFAIGERCVTKSLDDMSKHHDKTE